MPSPFFIGLMSGTSLDGVDGVLSQIDDAGRMKVLAHAFVSFAAPFRATLMALNQSGPDELHRSALAGNEVSRHYAQVVHALLSQTQLSAADILAIGAHGQTVRHRPLEFDGHEDHAAVGYTIQLINPSLLAELCHIDVVADFRSRDLAAGGQGAPLVPAFHAGIFGQANHCIACMNIGGISNISVLHAAGGIQGWDCGPGNALMDHWCLTHSGKAFDHNGTWASEGSVHMGLLERFLSEPFLHDAPPKSTGRDLFNPAWLSQSLSDWPELPAVDVQATLAELTAWTCAHDVRRYAPNAVQLIVCGGGALNGHLMRRLSHHLPDVTLTSSAALGLPPLQVEAAAFAWLAFKALRRETASLPSVTGARGARVLGAIYPR